MGVLICEGAPGNAAYFVGRTYQQERQLRNEVLLRPAGIPDFGWEMFDREAHHFVAVDGAADGAVGQVVGCVLLVPKEDGGKLIQMAVDPRQQGGGVGRLLVDALVARAQVLGLGRVYCDAREKAEGFYDRLGFHREGDWFLEAGIPHLKMWVESAQYVPMGGCSL